VRPQQQSSSWLIGASDYGARLQAHSCILFERFCAVLSMCAHADCAHATHLTSLHNFYYFVLFNTFLFAMNKERLIGKLQLTAGLDFGVCYDINYQLILLTIKSLLLSFEIDDFLTHMVG
jgi:hypothetical protein